VINQHASPSAMNRLTRQEQTVLAVALFLLAAGWCVKSWLAMQPQPSPPSPAVTARAD